MNPIGRLFSGGTAPKGGRGVAVVEVFVARPVWLPEAIGLLDAVERARLERLRRPADRSSYVTRHALARLVLAQATGLDPAQLRFTRDCLTCEKPHGKPRLASGPTGGPAPSQVVGPDGSIPFNLSGVTARAGMQPAGSASAAQLEAVAVLTHVSEVDGPPMHHEVGIDVEAVAATHFEGFDDIALHAVEREALAHLPESSREAARAAWWARKEAVVKAMGDGLRIDPATIATPPIGTAPQLLEPQRWPRLAISDLSDLDAAADANATAGAAANAAHVNPDIDAEPEPAGTVVGAVCVLGVDQISVVLRPGNPLLAAHAAGAGSADHKPEPSS